MWQGLAIKALVGAILMGGGVVAGVAWEHRPEPAGLHALAGPGLAVQRDRARIEARDWQIAAKGYEAALKVCEGKRDALAKAATERVTETADTADARGSSAYNSGYFAGRIAGRASCKKAPTDAPSPDAAPVPRPDGVRDLSKAFGAPYRPAGR